MKTRKQKRGYDKIQHHHFLLRMETKSCPLEKDKPRVKALVSTILDDIGMKRLDEPRIYYVVNPYYNEGLTAIVPIQTSHIAFHFWKNPEPAIMHSKDSKCLLEFDIYTCGILTLQQIHKVLHHLTQFHPTHVDITLLNRKWSLTIDRHMKWDLSESTWREFLESGRFH